MNGSILDPSMEAHGEPHRILYCFPLSSSFIRRDIEGLRNSYEVHAWALNAQPAWKLPFRLIHQLCWLLRHKAWKYDCICHFSGYHALLPTWFCRRTFIVLAGSDCASIPAIRYGNHSRKLMGWATRLAASRATRLLPVHASLMHRTQTFSDLVPAQQGILAFGPGIRTPWTVIPYGFDAEFWNPGTDGERDPNMFICVPGAASPTNRLHVLKGVKLVLEIAERIPSARFTIVGIADPVAYSDVPPNVSIIGHVDAATLRSLYRKASFHLQLSLSEGMPNALCEAMLCGCIPLVSRISSMPELVEGIGFVLDRDDPRAGARLGQQMLALSAAERDQRARSARTKVAREFPMQRRLDALSAVLQGSSGL